MDLLHTTALCNLAIFGTYTAVVAGAAAFYGLRARRRAAERVNAALDEALELTTSNTELHAIASQFYAEAILADDKLVNAEAMIEELKIDMGDLSQELAAAKVDMVETNTVCDAYAKQCQRTDDVVNHLTFALNSAGTLYFSTSELIEAQTESLIRVGLRAQVSRGPGALGRASDLEQAA